MENINLCENYDIIFTNTVQGGVDYLNANENIDTLIVGLSGGIDSFLTAAAARETINRLDRDVKLFGYSIPIISNEKDELERALLTGVDLCDSFAEVDLSESFTTLIPSIDKGLDFNLHGAAGPRTEEARIRGGNIKARLRMMFLYDKARKYGGMVLSTDNLTELLLGFWTLHGDVGDFGFIQSLWKTEVYGLTEHCRDMGIAEEAAELALEAKPTDGLGVSDSDLSQLLPEWKKGYREGYKEVDNVLIDWLKAEGEVNADEAFTRTVLRDHSVIQRHLRTEFKRVNPVNIPREQIMKGI